jgi:hypothetical protein
MEAERTTTDIAEERRIKRQTYMREYKRKKYAEDADIIKDKNKAYYYKNKFNLSSDDMKKYDISLPNVAKARYYLDLLREEHPEMLPEIIAGYMIV